jgi:hypothetical protein
MPTRLENWINEWFVEACFSMLNSFLSICEDQLAKVLSREIWIRDNEDIMIRVSWEKACFSYHQRDGTFYLAVDEERIRGTPDFCEIWERNYPVKSLSVQGGIRNGNG